VGNAARREGPLLYPFDAVVLCTYMRGCRDYRGEGCVARHGGCSKERRRPEATMRTNRTAALSLLTLALAACSAPPVAPELDGAIGASPDAIIGGTRASAYPEAALVDMDSGSCSGAVIAPRVVLTAGHCVAGVRSWTVRTPFAGNQQARVLEAKVYDWTYDPSGFVNPNQHDIGLLYLDRPITLASYPKLQRSKVANGTLAVNIGRIDNGTLSRTALFVSKPLPIRDAASSGFPYSYISSEVIQSGDSGGPVELAAGGERTIVAVNSGGGGGTQVLARVDLLIGWIDAYVGSHGGYATSVVPSPAPAPAPSPAPSPAPACASPESEPNDGYRAANALGATGCGALTAGDQDWFTWSIGAGAKSYELQLRATGDAQVRMWKVVNGQYVQIANDSPTSFVKQSSSAGTYVLGVWSASGAAQSYSLALTK
jgi:hypothetical protein